MERSLFTKIIDRDIPATIEYEDDSVIAIRDIAPVAPVHILIIPKKPIRSVNDIAPEDHALIGHVFHVAQQLAEKFNVVDSGYRVVTNINNDGGQTVLHLHYHLLGGEPLGHMTSKHAPTSIVAQSTHSTSPTIGITNAANWSRTFWRDLAIFLVAAIGLAYGYNELNPKHIKWVRTVYTRDTLVSTPAAMSATMSDTTRTDSTTQPSGISASLKMSARDSSLAAKRLADSLITSKARALKNGVDTAKLTPSAPCFVAESGVVKEISYGQFVTFIKMPCVTLIDARIPESYQKGHIRNAANINGTEAESPDVIQRLIKFERDKIIVIYCDGGECELSHRVADVLKNFGYGPIYIYTGGWAEWTKKNP